MPPGKAHIIAQLQKEIQPLQGLKHVAGNNHSDTGLGPIRKAFPGNVFPLGAVHEFICNNEEDAAVSSGFVAGILNKLLKNDGVCIWVSATKTTFPSVFKSFGITPNQIIYIHSKEKEVLWVIEEALKCEGLVAVVGEMRDLGFTESRRLQLAVEQSRVTGFVIRRNPRQLNTTACVSRWKISSLTSELPDDMPGVGFPKWKVELLKVRNGKPGVWEVGWVNGQFSHDGQIHKGQSDHQYNDISLQERLKKKAG